MTVKGGTSTGSVPVGEPCLVLRETRVGSLLAEGREPTSRDG